MDTAELAGRLIGFLIALGIPIGMIVAGQRRKKQTSGRRGKSLVIGGTILLVLVVLGLLGQAGQVASQA